MRIEGEVSTYWIHGDKLLWRLVLNPRARSSGIEGRANLAAGRSGLGPGAGGRAFLGCAILAGRSPVLGVLSEFPHDKVALQP
ncbi:MAG TPA: hypothetical protein VHT48_01915, partial [Methylocella sp.]|nr:hypothetical protein [Methylocella sp.]